MQVQSRVVHFLFMCHVNPKAVFFGVWWHKGWLVILSRTFLVMLKMVLLEVSFPVNELSRLQGVMLEVFVS